MSRIKNLKDKKFGRLKVIEFKGLNYENRALWECECECGNKTITNSKNLIDGCTSSCGCYQKESNIKVHTKHGFKHTKIYKIWQGMKSRCNNLNGKNYHNYGGRGIEYASNWETFEGFWKEMKFKWIYAQRRYGKNSSLSLERENVNGNYCFDNCIFIPRREQPGNTRKVRWFEAISPNGEKIIYRNANKFSREFNLGEFGGVAHCLSGRFPHYKGWKFRYLNEWELKELKELKELNLC